MLNEDQIKNFKISNCFFSTFTMQFTELNLNQRTITIIGGNTYEKQSDQT
jgi:hypothetical protein